ncbi:hypothetical protein B0H39_002497 [Clostridium beijerinckii]|uniref:hypothetical protein n=1 Tax=Clostridium beijerinckii TaxID=1520 RepID=UPI0014946BD2|nr:hypothetical protein [Clostridium beijerinckii]NOW84616.1 hypothetical protein [Clostridium beijerinckii]
MKRLKLRKAIACLTVALSLIAVAPVAANAAWKQNSTGWWYTEGSSYATGWREISGYWFFFKDNGYMATGWVQYQGHYFYLTSNGTMATNLWVQSGGNWYYLGSNGAMLKNTTINGYYLGSDGAWQSSAFQDKSKGTVKAGTNGASSQSMSEQNK